ncbi:hypothetical protein ABBQ32_012962 [Trebouxia sp. C0010 RCD-2024]
MTSESSICTKLTSLTYVIGSWPNFQTGSSSPVECGLAMAESLMWLKVLILPKMAEEQTNMVKLQMAATVSWSAT